MRKLITLLLIAIVLVVPNYYLATRGGNWGITLVTVIGVSEILLGYHVARNEAIKRLNKANRIRDAPMNPL